MTQLQLEKQTERTISASASILAVANGSGTLQSLMVVSSGNDSHGLTSILEVHISPLRHTADRLVVYIISWLILNPESIYYYTVLHKPSVVKSLSETSFIAHLLAPDHKISSENKCSQVRKQASCMVLVDLCCYERILQLLLEYSAI